MSSGNTFLFPTTRLKMNRVLALGTRVFQVTLCGGRTFLFFEDAGTSELLGALASHDARRLSDDDWLREWGIPGPGS